MYINSLLALHVADAAALCVLECRQSRRNKGSNLQAVAPPSSLDLAPPPPIDNGAGSSSKKPLELEDKLQNDALSENTCYPLSPNICVEGGRIEFIKIPPQNDLQMENYEEKIKQLEKLLAEERLKNEVNNAAVSKLQRQNAKKVRSEECSIKNEEKMKSTILMLQNDCRKLEEGVRSLLPYKCQMEQLKNEKLSISLAYEGKLQQYHLKLTTLLSDNEALRQRVRTLESKEAGYEACLDQVASQVVKALLSQKALKEEIVTLRGRIRDLEQQNLSLTSLICCQHQQQAKTLPETANKLAEPCPGVHLRPQSLSLQTSENPSEVTPDPELVAVKLGQFNARLSSLVNAKMSEHARSVEARLQEFSICDPPADTSLKRRSCEPSAPDLSCLSPEKRRMDITPDLIYTQQSTLDPSSVQRTLETRLEVTATSCPDVTKISFNEVPAKDEGYNTLTSEILPPDFETSLHTDLTRLLPDLAEESEASFEFSKLQPLRHSYPPLNTKIKFQHLLNYFSDSQLFLRFPDLNPGSVIRFSDFWDYEPGFDIDSSHSNFEFGGSESLWNIEELMKNERPVSLTPSITPSSSSDSDHSNCLSDAPHENSSNVEFTNDYYCLVKVGSVKSLSSSPQISSECGVVLCELGLDDKPQESQPLLVDTDDTCTTEDTQVEELQPENDMDLLEDLADTPSPSNEYDSKSSSDLDLSPSELEFFTLTDLKHKRYGSRRFHTDSLRRHRTSNNLSRHGKSKSESQLNYSDTNSLNRKRPQSECFHNKFQSIHKSYYNNFIKFSPKRYSVSSDDLQIPTLNSPQFKNEHQGLKVLNNQEEIKTENESKIVSTNNEPSTSKTDPSACHNDQQSLYDSDMKDLLQKDFDCIKGETDFTSDSKKIIETLNRMIQKSSNSSEEQLNRNSVEYKEGIPTSWVHFEKQTNFSDPKERANLLDRMLAAVPSSEESEDDFKDYQHLLRLHRRRRHRKAYMHHGGFLRNSASCSRASIVGQRGLFTRYGEAEKQAVASFDFLFEVDDDQEEQEL
ncbi:hypothetical protein B566_EDAN007855 [Ephemera danica]|nr:hypothetical protein B566_EDAN007855 [Ephemera danica]